MINWKERFRASGIHFGISLAIAALAGLLVFGIWYPYPYREISGGRELFLIVVTVDVILGPLITLAVFNRRKPWTELRRDLGVVAMIQLGALGYGLWTVAVARPVHLVFEIDRFRVVHAVDVPEDLVGRQPDRVKGMPWLGPTLLAVRPFRDSQENMNATMAALDGMHLGTRPDLWEPYNDAKSRVLETAKPITELKRRFADRAGEIDGVLKSAGKSPQELGYLPMVGRSSFWTVFVDLASAEVVAFMPLDPF